MSTTPEYFVIHRGTRNSDGFTPVLFLVPHSAEDGEFTVETAEGQLYFDPSEDPPEQLCPWFHTDNTKNGWETPLYSHLRRLADGVEVSWTLQARVLCAIVAAVEDLEEDHWARICVLESSIRDLAEDTLANLVPECRRPAGSFPVFEALGKVLEAIDICEVHP
jgi:hypothetical protein